MSVLVSLLLSDNCSDGTNTVAHRDEEKCGVCAHVQLVLGGDLVVAPLGAVLELFLGVHR